MAKKNEPEFIRFTRVDNSKGWAIDKVEICAVWEGESDDTCDIELDNGYRVTVFGNFDTLLEELYDSIDFTVDVEEDTEEEDTVLQFGPRDTCIDKEKPQPETKPGLPKSGIT